MEKATYKHYGIVIGMLAISLLLFSLVDLTPVVEETTVALSLPDNLGPFTSESIVFCQNLHCQKSMLKKKLSTYKTCNYCGSEVGVLSPAEANMLPNDTIILRKLYSSPEGTRITASIVITGKQRTSIHRPQMCLVAQGYSIERQHIKNFALNKSDQLVLTVLDLKSPGQNRIDMAYAYWFVSSQHSTPYHVKRMLLTAYDNLFKGTAPRWGYISLMTENSIIEGKQLKLFIHLFSQHIEASRNPNE